MTDQPIKIDARVAEFERQFEAEGARIKRLLDELCASKIIGVSIVDTKDQGDDLPMFITLRLDPPKLALIESPDNSLTVTIEGNDRGRNYIH